MSTTHYRGLISELSEVVTAIREGSSVDPSSARKIEELVVVTKTLPAACGNAKRVYKLLQYGIASNETFKAELKALGEVVQKAKSQL